MARIDPLLSALNEDYVLPTQQAIANAAIIAVFAYLVPLLTMEINFFRLAVYRSWRRQTRLRSRRLKQSSSRKVAAVEEEEGGEGNSNSDNSASSKDDLIADDGNDNDSSNSSDSGSDSPSAVGHLMNDVTVNVTSSTQHANDPSLQRAYNAIRHSSMQAISSSLIVYSLTAVGIALSTRGLSEKVIAIIVGASQFMAALMVFIVSAKIPQWIGVYHEGSIRLVKCSSNYSQHIQNLNLLSNDDGNDDETNLSKLRSNVRLGVWFHFSKFYIVLMPFYCGVRQATIPLSIVCGVVFGFILMWAVFVVHEKYIHHRNIVSFTTIILLSIVSALTFTRGMAWIQVVWKLNILKNEDALMIISFFTWLGLLAAVHTLFIWHTLRSEESKTADKIEDEDANENEEDVDDVLAESEHTPKMGKNKLMKRTSSYSSYVFDPRTHFVDGKCQFSDHPDLDGDSFTDGLTDVGGQGAEDLDLCIETPIVAEEGADEDTKIVVEFDNGADQPATVGQTVNNSNRRGRSRCPAFCQIFICFSPEYQQSSCLWKTICWIKIMVMTLTYFLCLYFVIVCIGATYQISATRAALPAVQEALYNHMNEGPVCAFDNQGPESNITTFENKEAANEAGFLVVHCGACGACSKWDNLIVQYTTRDTMAKLANQCARDAMFGGGNDAIADCIMDPNGIGFDHECALCWQEDIVCTQGHCAFIFLQSQMINNVGNFAVGENEITAATCEEAHCEVGQFVPCSGATRRRMNIVSSISRPGDQQCGIVDVESWEDLFFGSGVA